MENRLQKIKEAAAYLSGEISAKLSAVPEIALILGSGLGVLADEIQQPVVIDYDSIPHFPQTTVEGHAGQFVAGMLNGRYVLAMQGRFHYYEGYSMQEVTFPVYVMKELGISVLIVTNAAGGMNRQFQPGDLMIITDHINLTGSNPLIGPNLDDYGPRFPDLSEAYSRRLANLTGQKAKEAGITVQRGVYAGISGPAYMTPSELTMLARLGADALGMSTVAEVIAARHCGIEVLGISCITDMAIGEELEPLTHEQVIAVANRARPTFISLVKSVIPGV